MARSLFVLGGRQRKRILKKEEEWALYEKAVILEVNPETSDARVCVEYETPGDARPDDGFSVLFKAGSAEGNKLYACTSTEVMIYDLPHFKRSAYISLPCFNDLHHVRPTPEGNLVVANTGLDMVVELTLEGKVLREWNVLGGDPWEHFSRSVDYRKVGTTKPHRSHPNHVFFLDKNIWVTRAQQKDAVCLTDGNRRIPLGGEFVHDGCIFGGMIYFTSVDGRLIRVDRNSLQIVDVIDFKAIDGGGGQSLGWCRGLWIVDERHVWVGFTRVRKTKFMENVNWVKHAGKGQGKPARVALYDIAAKTCLAEIDVEKYGLNVVFNMLPVLQRVPGFQSQA
ncbi:MAG: hypothetical protein WBX38_19015 [Candidatus Sulfotelmatobacter sp.]